MSSNTIILICSLKRESAHLLLPSTTNLTAPTSYLLILSLSVKDNRNLSRRWQYDQTKVSLSTFHPPVPLLSVQRSIPMGNQMWLWHNRALFSTGTSTSTIGRFLSSMEQPQECIYEYETRCMVSCYEHYEFYSFVSSCRIAPSVQSPCL